MAPRDVDQGELFFDGESYEPERDQDRLGAQLQAVEQYTADKRWHFLAEIAQAVHAPEASVSARLRDLRKYRFGGYTVDREYVRDGLWRYRVRPPAANGNDDDTVPF